MNSYSKSLGLIVQDNGFGVYPRASSVKYRSTDERGLALKKPPTGSSPSMWLWEILKERRRDRFGSSLGRLPERLFSDRSTASSLERLARAAGTGPVVKLFAERIKVDKDEQLPI